MKRKNILVYYVIILLLTNSITSTFAQKINEKMPPKIEIRESDKTLHSQWSGKKVAFLGDSMTDKRRVGTTCVYWEYLAELLGIEPFVYGISGNQWTDIYKQAEKLYAEKGNEIDAIFIFAGTNDYNANAPLGNFFTEATKETNRNGKKVICKYRTQIMNDATFCGRINKAMSLLKEKFPTQQIIILTPIHRGYANFNARNVQPDENYANLQGLFLDSYIDVLKQAATYWAVPLIDLHSVSGLYPLAESQNIYFHSKENDLLHPNAIGDYRLARTIQYQLLSLPSSFKEH